MNENQQNINKDEKLHDYEFRLLDADEIECRVGQGGSNGANWCTLLLYKDARCDMRRLDEKFGIFGWSRKHEYIGQDLYCTVSVYKEGIGWVSKQDVGTPSNVDKEKGRASDAFKRACYCLGIGRELYTAPKIRIPLSKEYDYYEANGKLVLRSVFHVAFVYYFNRRISKLIIQDQNNQTRYWYGMTDAEVQEWITNQNANYGSPQPAPKTEDSEEVIMQKNYAYPQLQQAQIWEDVDKVWNGYTDLQSNEEFMQRCYTRKMELALSMQDLVAIWNMYPDLHEYKDFTSKMTQFKSKFV